MIGEEGEDVGEGGEEEEGDGGAASRRDGLRVRRKGKKGNRWRRGGVRGRVEESYRGSYNLPVEGWWVWICERDWRG